MPNKSPLLDRLQLRNFTPTTPPVSRRQGSTFGRKSYYIHVNRKAANIFSGIFFGVFIAPILTIIWFVVPWLRYIAVGDDSPYVVGLPLGFCLGMAAALELNRRFRWGRAGAIGGAILLVIAIACSAIAYSNMMKNEDWGEGLGWFVRFLVGLLGIVSAVGLLLSGVFSHLQAKDTVSLSKVATT